MLVLGQVGLATGLVASMAAVAALLFGKSAGKDGVGASRLGYYLTFASMIGITISTLVLTVAFFTKDYSITYVASNHATDSSSLAWLYTLSGLWAGREGSLLFWAWLLTLFSTYVAFRGIGEDDSLTHMAVMVLNVVTALFTIAMIFSEPNNPFIATPAEFLVNGQLVGQAASWGMNPLLQHWAMILHPPTLFIGYAGLTVGFAFAMASLIVNDATARWIDLSDRITIFSWLFLGAGIGLGSVWAYVVLGWGGYWAWDPVENASILPWFVGVAMIHSFTMYRRRNAFKRWAIMLSALTFSMVILGTFITRSGIVQSVHAFAPDELSLWLFLAMIIGSVVAALVGLSIRWQSYQGADEFESLTSREAAYYFNNVLMTVASLLIAYMTVASALPTWLPFGGQSLGAIAYELIARPVGILYLFILAVCPILSWTKTEGRDFLQRAVWPTVGALVVFALLLWEWVVVLRPTYADMVALGGEPARKFLAFGPQIIYDLTAVIGLFVASFVVVNTLALFVTGVMGRMKATGENPFVAFVNVLFKARSQSGGYLSHIAMGIIVIGLIGSSMYVRDISKNIPMKAGETVEISNYSLIYTAYEDKTLPNGDIDSVAHFDVKRDGKPIGTMDTSMTSFAVQGQTRLNAQVLGEPLRDIFVVFQGISGESGSEQISLNVKINPLIRFVWFGFGLLLVGTALATWPRKKAYAA